MTEGPCELRHPCRAIRGFGVEQIEAKKVSRGYAEPFCNNADILKTDIAFSPFHASEVAPVELDKGCESFLRVAPLLPKLADPPPEQDFRVLGCHALTMATCFPNLHVL